MIDPLLGAFFERFPAWEHAFADEMLNDEIRGVVGLFWGHELVSWRDLFGKL